MKRQRASNQAKLALKEPKLEPDDEYSEWNSHSTSSQCFDSTKLPKMEEPDYEPDPLEELFSAKPHKEIVQVRYGGSDYEEKKPEKIDAFPKWRPKIESVTDFLQKETFDDFDCDMSLGSSVLFDTPTTPTSNINKKNTNKISPKKVELEVKEEDDATSDEDFYDPSEDADRKCLPPSKLRAEFHDAFESNPHPSALEIQELAEKCGVRYRTVFDNFEEKRKKGKIECEENDACERIRRHLAREVEKFPYMDVTNQAKIILEEELEIQLLSRKRFSMGYLHAMMDKVNLPPMYIRGQYETWKRKLMTKDRDDYRLRTMVREDVDPNNALTIHKLRQLEDAYLNKKYHSEEKEWSPKDLRILAAQTDLDVEVVEKWINKRNDATLGLEHNVIEFRRDRDAKVNAASGRKLPTWKSDKLWEKFHIDPNPGRAERLVMARELDLDEPQVRNFFNKKRNLTRKQVTWDLARREFMALSKSKKEQFEKIASERRKPVSENMEIARRLGVSYTTLASYIDWRKSVNAAKTNKFHF